MSLVFGTPAGPLTPGATFQVPLTLDGGTDVASVPVQFRYDPAHLELVNVAEGNFLSQGGQAVALIHRDDGPGDVTIVASRPPGVAGVNGSGVVCVLTFVAKAPGATALAMTRAGAVDSKQQPVPAQAAQATIMVK